MAHLSLTPYPSHCRFRLRQAKHEGRVSSHFFRRARQVQQPVLVRVTPDLDGGDLACGGDMVFYDVWLVKECGLCWQERVGDLLALGAAS